jgi:hypothetical protein
MRRVYICFFAALVLFGCSSRKTAVEQVVKETLVDPDSAKFGTMKDFTTSGGTKRVCIEVNAKNRMGGYNGTEIAILDAKEDRTFDYVRSVELPSCDEVGSER